jgi:hypothetical protein
VVGVALGGVTGGPPAWLLWLGVLGVLPPGCELECWPERREPGLPARERAAGAPVTCRFLACTESRRNGAPPGAPRPWATTALLPGAAASSAGDLVLAADCGSVAPACEPPASPLSPPVRSVVRARLERAVPVVAPCVVLLVCELPGVARGTTVEAPAARTATTAAPTSALTARVPPIVLPAVAEATAPRPPPFPIGNAETRQ